MLALTGLAIGIVMVWKGADYFIDNAIIVAHYFHVPLFVIGLTVVAVGTSLPELRVGLISAWYQSDQILLGNVAGANAINLVLIGAGLSVFFPQLFSHLLLNRNTRFVFAMTIIVFYTISTNFWFETHQLTWLDGIVLILVYAGMIVNLMKHKKITKPDILPTTDQTVMRSVWFIMIASLAALMIGADIVVKNSMSIAKRLGMSQHWVGLTFTSIGTTLPELATALSAIRHKEFGLIRGNILGSCLCNFGLVLGLPPFLYAMSVEPKHIFDVLLTGIILGVIVLVRMATVKLFRYRVWASFIVIGYGAYIILSLG